MHGCLSACLVCMLSYLSSFPHIGGLHSSSLHIVGLQRESTVGYTFTPCVVCFTCPRPPGTRVGYSRTPISGRRHICSSVLHSPLQGTQTYVTIPGDQTRKLSHTKRVFYAIWAMSPSCFMPVYVVRTVLMSHKFNNMTSVVIILSMSAKCPFISH